MQIGSRVKVVKNCEDGSDEKWVGATGTIRDFDDDGYYAEVELDGEGQSTFLFGAYQLEVIVSFNIPKDYDSLTPENLEQRMLIAKDIKKEFYYNKFNGLWYWHDRGEENIENYDGPYYTFWDALCDATSPYYPGEEEDF